MKRRAPGAASFGGPVSRALATRRDPSRAGPVAQRGRGRTLGIFNPMVGIAEDPATGTAAGPLVAALVARGEVAPGVEAIVEQGFALGRPSRLRVTVDGDDVRLSGTGLVVAEGTVEKFKQLLGIWGD